jgi:hypothetical protein
MRRGPIDLWTKTRQSIARLSASVPSRHTQFLVAFTTSIAESNFRYTQVSNIVLDTSAVATDTIDYVATDTSGNAATSTRTVIVEAQASSPPAVSSATTSAAISTTQ